MLAGGHLRTHLFQSVPRLRPSGSCHTALFKSKNLQRCALDGLEGDIKACFGLFRPPCPNQYPAGRRLKTTSSLFSCEVSESGIYGAVGVPQELIRAHPRERHEPYLANITSSSWNTLWRIQGPFDTEPFKPNARKNMSKLQTLPARQRKKLDAGDHSKEAVKSSKKSGPKLKLSTPYANVLGRLIKRDTLQTAMQMNFCGGVSARSRTGNIHKKDFGVPFSEKLKLNLSEEKTKVNHSSEAVRYLGYDIRVVRDKGVKRKTKRCAARVWVWKGCFPLRPTKVGENKLHELRVSLVNGMKRGPRLLGGPCTETSCSTARILKIVRQ